MARKDITAGAFDAAFEFHRRKLWKQFTNYDCFGVRIAGQDELMLAVVLGDAGEEYGLSLFRGPHAAATLAELLSPEGPGDDTLEDMDTLGLSMEAFGDLPPDIQMLFRETGEHPRSDEEVPSFLAKPAGEQGRLPSESELVLLGQVLRAIIKAYDSRMLKPATLEDEEGIFVIRIGGKVTEPDVTVIRERVEQEGEPTTIPLLASSSNLANLPRLKTTWLVGMPALPAAIEGDDRAMQMLLVVDEASTLIVQGKPVFSGDLKDAVDTLAQTFQGRGLKRVKGLPRNIIFSSRNLHDAMTPILEPLGVKCKYSANIPQLQAIVEEFYDLVDSDLAPFGGYVEGDEVDMPIPAPDDLRGWKEADKRLFDRFADHFDHEDRLWGARPVTRYFGDDDLEYYMQEHEQQGVVMAYTAWGILDYRPTKKSKTHAEKMLEEGLPEPEAILLRARMEALPTLYRVARHNPKAGTLDLEDVLLGGTVTIHDQMMSENIQDGLFLTARTFAAGQFRFIEMAGPPLGPGMGTEAADFLQYCGMKFTPEGLRKDAHKFGRLWAWMDEWQANWKPPRMCNTDGDELLWHTASFSVAAPEQTRQTLMQREDIDHDEEADELVWNKAAKGNNRVIGETVMLGRIEFVGDELVLTVNSARRFETARKWLEKLPGVVFKGVQTRRWNEAEKDRPLDERISPPEPIEMTPELADSLQEMMDKHYISWLDTSLPALNGKTPRQACRTKAGRQEVTMLIRTMPDPAGPVPIRAPREAMLRELGLENESSLARAESQIPAAPIPIEAVPSKPRVPRNAPCPCGSGRKYKKCCGREQQQRS
jgi:hypothetical protein